MPLTIPPLTESDSGQTVDVSKTVFGQDFNEGLVHQLVTTYLARGRSGTKGQKSRANVQGGGSKPWRQKGTGRARSGTSRSPIWRSGGVTFAARPRVYDKKLNKKMYRAGMRSILSELLRQERVFVSEMLSPAEPKTKQLVNILKQKNTTEALIVVNKDDRNLSLASRNLPHVDVCTSADLNPVNLMASKRIILTLEAIKDVEEHLG